MVQQCSREFAPYCFSATLIHEWRRSQKRFPSPFCSCGLYSPLSCSLQANNFLPQCVPKENREGISLRGIPQIGACFLRLLRNLQLCSFFAVSAKLLFPPGGFERHARAFFYLWHVVQHALQPIGLTIEERAGTSPRGRERNSRANSSFLSCATSNTNLGPLFLPLFEFYPWQASKRVFFSFVSLYLASPTRPANFGLTLSGSLFCSHWPAFERDGKWDKSCCKNISTGISCKIYSWNTVYEI